MVDAIMVNDAQIKEGKDGDDMKSLLNLIGTSEERKWVLEEDHLKFKYLLTMEGNTAPWCRVPWILASNSALVKQETSSTQYFYSALKPFVHYIPVNERLTDLISTVQWMRANDDKVKDVAEAGSRFIENNMTPEDVDIHFVLILNLYHDLMKGDIKLTF